MAPNSFRSCVVCGKNKRSDSTLKFHYFPRNRKRCKEWVETLNIPYLKTKPLEQLSSTCVVCSNHFSHAYYTANGRLLSSATPVTQASLMNVVGTSPKDDGISSIDASSNPKVADHLLRVPEIDPFTSGFGLLSYSTDEADDIGLQISRDTTTPDEEDDIDFQISRDTTTPDQIPPPGTTEPLPSHTTFTPLVEVILKEEPGGSATADTESSIFIKEEPTFKEEPQEWDGEPQQWNVKDEEVIYSTVLDKEQKISGEELESCSSDKDHTNCTEFHTRMAPYVSRYSKELCNRDEQQANCGDSVTDSTDEYLPSQDDDAQISHDLMLDCENIMAEQKANAAHVIKERERIIGLFKSGLSVRSISQTLGLHRSTVYKWVNRWQKDRSLKTKPRSGRPRATTREEDKAIMERALQQPFATAIQITQDLQLKCSPLTTRKRLHSSNIQQFQQGHP